MEETQACSNCGLALPESKLMLHELYCLRNCVKCEVCSKFYDVNNQEEHDLEHEKREVSEEPKKKKKEMKQQYKEHVVEEKQEEKTKKCQFCQVPQLMSRYEDHQVQCGSRTMECGFCQKRIALKIRQDHELECFQRQNFPQLFEKGKTTKQNGQERKEQRKMKSPPRRYEQQQQQQQQQLEEEVNYAELGLTKEEFEQQQMIEASLKQGQPKQKPKRKPSPPPPYLEDDEIMQHILMKSQQEK